MSVHIYTAQYNHIVKKTSCEKKKKKKKKKKKLTVDCNHSINPVKINETMTYSVNKRINVMNQSDTLKPHAQTL